jgi:hypothetical protein
LHCVARCSCSLLSSQRTGGGQSRTTGPVGGVRRRREASRATPTLPPRRWDAWEAAPSQRNSDAGAAALAPRWCPDGPVPRPLDSVARGALALADPGVEGATSAPTGQ